MPTATDEINLLSFWNITCIFTAILRCCCHTLFPLLTLNCRNSTKLPTPTVEYSCTFGWYFESSQWPRKGKPSLPNVTIASIIGANTLRCSSTSCLSFLPHNRLIFWLEPLIWEKLASSFCPCWKWRLSADSC